MHHSANLQICGMLLGVSWTNLHRFPEVDTWGVNVKQLPKRWCAKFLSSDVTVPPQKLYRTALRLTNVFVIVLNNGFNSLVNKEKATSYSCLLYANVGVVLYRIVFLSHTVTYHRNLHYCYSFWSRFLVSLSITRSDLKKDL